MLDRIIALLSIIIAVAAYVLSGFNIWIAVIAMVVCALVFRSLKSIFQEKLERVFPPLTVYYPNGEDLSNQSAKGMRVIVITEKIFFHMEAEPDKKFILDYIDRYVEELSKSSRIFKYRYNYVKKHNLPCQPAYAACRNAKTSLKMVYKKWLDTSGAGKFGATKEDVDSFMVDDVVTDPRDGSEHRTMLQFVFDPNLPLPDENYQ